MKTKKFINKKPYLISGPCSAESQDQILKTAILIQEYADVFRAGIWKPRTSPNSFSGVGEIGLNWLQMVKEKTSLKVATEVATPKHVELCLNAGIDILWLGARTTVNPFYVQEIAEALKGVDIPVFVKNPIHPELSLWLGAFERLNKAGIKQIGAIHRGFYSNEISLYRNDPKWEVLIKLRELATDIPIICDPSHISGKVSIIQDISQIAMDLNLEGLMIETHFNPSVALSDSQQQITPDQLKNIMSRLILREATLNDQKINAQLVDFRSQIDILDKKIIKLLNNRKKVVEQIAEFKLKNRVTIFQLERWFEILKTRKEIGEKTGLDSKIITDIFQLIHKYSILTQTRIMRE